MLSRMVAVAAVVVVALVVPCDIAAQESRFEAALGAGRATVWDDEGMLGRGLSLQGSVGVTLGRRVVLQGVFDRMPYERDTSWLRFDGRTSYVGAEALFMFGSHRARPFVSVGGGVGNDSHTWVHKSQSIGGVDLTTTTEHASRFPVLASGVGLDIATSNNLSIRPHVKIYQMYPSDDLDPHFSIRPGLGVSVRWN